MSLLPFLFSQGQHTWVAPALQPGRLVLIGFAPCWIPNDEAQFTLVTMAQEANDSPGSWWMSTGGRPRGRRSLGCRLRTLRLPLVEAGKSRDALEWTRKAIELDPKNAHVWQAHGFVLYQLHRFDEGLAAYERAVGLAPELAGEIDIETMRSEVEVWNESR